MPSLSQMKYIVSVFETQSFIQASQECHVSQPSLSMQVQKAEEELDVKIFDRNTKPIRPTDKGRRLIEQMRVILNESKRLEDLSKTEAGQISGRLDLAIIPTVAPYLLSKTLNSFSTQLPQVQMSIFEQTTSEIIFNLKNKSLDVGVLATPLDEPDLIEIPLYYEPFYVLAHNNHPLLKNKIVTEKDVAQHAVWLLKEGHCFRKQTLSLCYTEQTVLNNIDYEGGSIHTLGQIVLQSGGCTLIPHMALNELPASIIDKNVRKFKKPYPSREISLVFHKSQWKTDVLDAIQKIIEAQVEKKLQKNQSLDIVDVLSV